MSKYHARKMIIDGITFDSKKEAMRYCELKLLEKAGQIADLRLQVPFELLAKQRDERAVKYIADFVYYDKSIEKTVVEDVKGVKPQAYIIKRKLFKKRYGEKYEFREV